LATQRASFGPSALATPANLVTIARLMSTPVLFAVVLASPSSWGTFALWVVLAGTDGVDGIIARRHGTTTSGAFLDPLADKFLVLAAMVALSIQSVFAWAPVVIIAAREAVISGYRSIVARQGISVPARPGAKVKTVIQDLAVGVALLPSATPDHLWVAEGLLWGAAALTVVTGIQYLVDGRRTARAV
jgi:CDP-diacylglycerol---glycerol-3-phosphate 3-phosphatidyltransferase